MGKNTDEMTEWLAFYAALDGKNRRVVERETKLVIQCMQIENRSRLEIGRHLVAIREKLIPKGATGPRTKAIWGGWLRAHKIGISRSTLFNYINGWERLSLQAGVHAEKLVSALGRRGYIGIAPSKVRPLGKFTAAFHELGLPRKLKSRSGRLTEQQADELADKIANKSAELKDVKNTAAKQEREQRGEAFYLRQAFDATLRSFRQADAASNKDLDAEHFLGELVGRLLTAFGIAGKQTYRPMPLSAGWGPASAGQQPAQSPRHEVTNGGVKAA